MKKVELVTLGLFVALAIVLAVFCYAVMVVKIITTYGILWGLPVALIAAWFYVLLDRHVTKELKHG